MENLPKCSSGHAALASVFMKKYEKMVIDPKVLVGTADDDGLGVGKISFGESFFSSWRKYFFRERIGESFFFYYKIIYLLAPLQES